MFPRETFCTISQTSYFSHKKCELIISSHFLCVGESLFLAGDALQVTVRLIFIERVIIWRD